jgi:RNA polymerase sigma-70 factor (ECF subfamily)
MSTVLQKAPDLNGSPRVADRTDENLLLAYRDSQRRDLFEELVRRYERELFSYLRRYVGDADLAADVFQATFLQLHLKCSQFQEGRRLRPWLYTIATNQAIDAQRRNRRHRMVSLDILSGGSDDDVVKLLDLPEHLRSVVTLVYYQGLKYREAAEALLIPVGTVKSRMHTALLKLNEVFRDSQVRSK